jgi:hypothetical protein
MSSVARSRPAAAGSPANQKAACSLSHDRSEPGTEGFSRSSAFAQPWILGVPLNWAESSRRTVAR